MLQGVVLELRLGSAAGQHHRRAYFLTQSSVRVGKDSRVGDGGMSLERLLDLDRGDLLPTAVDLLLEAPRQVEVAILIEPAKVSSVEPALAKCLPPGARAIQVPLHQQRPPDNHFSHLAGS